MARLTNLSERGIETQRMLSDVLMQLLGETNYNKISVKDITVRAGIDRSTFYLHFKDKDDLFLAGQKRLVEELLEARNNSELPYPLATRAFEQMARYPRPYLALLSDVENSYFSVQLQEYMSAMARPLLETTLREKGLQTSLDAGMIIGYLTGALRGLGRWWLEAGQPYPPAEMARWFVETVRTGLNSLNPPQLETKE